MSSDDIQWPLGFGYKDLVAYGATGLVVLDSATQTVIKKPFSLHNREAIERERQIYERLAAEGRHSSILSYHGVFEDGIRLEYAAKHDLRSFMLQCPTDPSLHLLWMSQIADALVLIHSLGIIHGDLTTTNVFLDENLNAKLADFGASSIDGSSFLAAVTDSHQCPGDDVLSAQVDIFAFGSMIYEVATGERPYSELTEVDIRTNFENGVFPEVESLGALGVIIESCWQGSYKNSKALHRSIQAIQREPETTPQAYSPPLILYVAGIALVGLICVKLVRAAR